MAARALLWATFAASTPGSVIGKRTASVNSTTCNGAKYSYDELAGYGFVPSNAIDKLGDTLGGLGSSLHLDQGAWRKHCNGSYSGILWSLPDRGWNTEGTLNYNPRVHKFQILFTPRHNATVSQPSAPNLEFFYLDTITFSGPDGTPATGLDGDAIGHLSYPGFPDLPVATYEGDGFGGEGPGGKRIPLDPEGLYVNDDGSFWVSDEYGPYIYLFSSMGTMLTAIRPPESIIPKRNGTDSFSANSPPRYLGDDGDDVSPEDPDTGRDNNHGFEGLTVSADGKSLYVLLQAATVQEGGLEKQTQRPTRFLKYDVSDKLAPVYVGEWTVPLPSYVDPTASPKKNPKVAAQSEILALENGQFFVLSRDSGAGNGQDVTKSVYRQIDVFDISDATDIKAAGGYDCADVECAVADADTGVLKTGITAAKYCGFLDFNVNAQLNRFNVHNGGNADPGLLNEKWESLGLVPVNPKKPNGEYFVFSLSDNDFITQYGYMNGGELPYADESGYNLDSQALVFKITIS
ncbi:esterase-like activity of phytase-domain-containing protein [Xylaria bambusicola]|uniref:esterase-like activity of phytase-domain-containing protein n=1 Tax=Xylaria bambusicola TaxID=326684 RepID=UPI0020078968|nr:esterase-like activity of phytase-domain-containing protein [Xylaria bambusicola]KAI0503442.1 esterase-like activity of phytase-domain-containing protein [Xylaria bambusicola]